MIEDDIFSKAKKVKTPIEELEILADLADSVAFTVIKRVVIRYTEKMRELSFSLDQSSPNFIQDHIRCRENAKGMELLVKIIQDSRREKARLEKDGDI